MQCTNPRASVVSAFIIPLLYLRNWCTPATIYNDECRIFRIRPTTQGYPECLFSVPMATTPKAKPRPPSEASLSIDLYATLHIETYKYNLGSGRATRRDRTTISEDGALKRDRAQPNFALIVIK